jgi:predicted esterase
MVARKEVDAKASALVGASIGANLALIVGANNAEVVTVIALSPGEDYHGLTPSPLLPNFNGRPVLFVASQDDAYSYTSAQKMVTLAPAGETYYLANAGHGTAMFSNPNLELALIDWLRKQLGILKG